MVGYLLLSVLAVAGSGKVSARCDLVEVNHHYVDSEQRFTQVIAWDWDYQYKRWHAQQWVIVDKWTHDSGVTSVQDETGLQIRGRLFRETWSVVDPERANQVLFPGHERRRVW